MPAAGESSLSPITAEQRLGRGALMMIWWGLCSAVYYIFVAAALAERYGASNAILGMGLAVTLFSLVAAILVPSAIRHGYSVLLLSHRMLGKGGAVIVPVLLALIGLYYAVFEGSVLAVTMTKVVPGLDFDLACFLVVLLVAPLASGRAHRAVDGINKIMLPLYLGGLILLVALLLRDHGMSTDWLTMGPADPPFWGWWDCFTAYLGILVLSMVLIDIARFGRPADTRYHALVTFGAPFYLMTIVVNGTVGIFLVGTVFPGQITETSVVDSTILVMGGVPALLFIWATQTRINVVNFSVAAGNLQGTWSRLTGRAAPRWLVITVIGIAVALMMQASDIFSWLLQALTYQSVFITAWLGVALAFLSTTEESDGPSTDIETRSRRRLFAWILGAALGVISLQFDSLRAVAAPLSLIAAFLFFPLFQETGTFWQRRQAAK